MLRCTIILGILLINVVIGSGEDAAVQDKWKGKWFPKKPGDADPKNEPKNIVPSGADPSPETESNHNVLQGAENNEVPEAVESNNIAQNDVGGQWQWHGKWFPKRPAEYEPPHLREGFAEGGSVKKQLSMGTLDPNCDDAQTNLEVDYDPKNLTHQAIFICTEDRSLYNPNLQNRPTLLEYTIPSEYSALHKCMNETITYTDNIPTFGIHRMNWPVYGEYDYVPVQRWLHNLEHGAIVVLYHPCANRQQQKLLKKLVKSCMYRHIITAHEKLTADRPFALVAWGKSLEMSYIEPSIVVGFIRMNGLQAPEKISRDGQYTAGLKDKANIVSDVNDSNLCPGM